MNGSDKLLFAVAIVLLVLLVVVVVVIARRRGRPREKFEDVARDSESRTQAFDLLRARGGNMSFTEMKQHLPKLDAVAYTDLMSDWRGKKNGA